MLAYMIFALCSVYAMSINSTRMTSDAKNDVMVTGDTNVKWETLAAPAATCRVIIKMSIRINKMG